jgi:hypothetical protein
MTTKLPRWWPFAALAVIVALAASRLWLVPLHYSSDHNEGWNAFQALRAMGQGPLYPPSDALTGNNYPPLSFLVVGALARLIGDEIVAGRLIAFTAVTGVAALIAVTLRRLGSGREAAWGGALLFLLLNATLLRKYLAVDDPQWLGHLLMTAALPLLLSAQPAEEPARGRVILAALLMLAGGLVKQNLVAWPIAATAWLALHHRRAMIAWLATAVIAGGATLLACWWSYGPDLFRDMLGAARDYSLGRMASRSLPAVAVMLPLIWWAWPLVKLRHDDRRIDLILIAILVAVPLGIIQRSGAGVDINAHFEAFIALSIGAALALPLHVQRGRAVKAVMAACLAILVTVGAIAEVREVSQLPRRRAASDAMIGHIAAIRGPVACEIQALCYWAGKSFELDYFLYSQRARQAGASPALDRIIRQRRLAGAMIAPNGPDNEAERARKRVVSRITQEMRPLFVDSDGRRLMVPRQ